MNRFKRPLTPAEISPTFKALITELVLGGCYEYVDVHPLEDAPAKECFPLVKSLVERHGGELVVGWALWEFPTPFVEAELRVAHTGRRSSEPGAQTGGLRASAVPERSGAHLRRSAGQRRAATHSPAPAAPTGGDIGFGAPVRPQALPRSERQADSERSASVNA